VVDPAPVLVSGNSTALYDLKKSLPSTVKAGGSFSVDSSGTSLPAGIALSADGVLSAASASVGSFSGVVFAYTEPL
jgi:hypothetical protein